MVNDKGSYNDLATFYYGCPSFKQYCHYKFCCATFNEDDALKYCRKFIYKVARTIILNVGVLQIKNSSLGGEQIGFESTNRCNQMLLGVVKVLDDFADKPIEVCLHKNINIIFKDNLNLRAVSYNPPFLNFNILLKSFKRIFMEHALINQITPKLLISYKVKKVKTVQFFL